ncbi:hypothetical protein C9J12_28675 [Photobacterium frigidiphilum]|uniref:Type II secretion system protein GspF domain-containing protein n=1 Tax=Photobacterium frigidiphilum TaxID=264736 RepID=A0A2T3J677_9GAMM|nr:hypothetical protein [Photobacterium frigidiphilum]PSU42839.1 hypothetical protein C9J12_28675 [Photobacterium frigidiphilum]
MKSLTQLLFSQQDQITLLAQWKHCDEYGLSTRQFCDALIENGTSTTKEIGQAGKDAPTRGEHFTDVLMDWYPPHIVNAIAFAEQAGDRQAGLTAGINQLQGGQNIMLSIIKLLWFPFALMIVAGGLGLYVSDSILDSMKEKGGIGQTLNDIVSTYGIAIALGLLLFIFLITLALPTLTGPLRRHLDSLPVFAVYKIATAASVLNTLGNLLACGIKLDDALKAIETSGSPYERFHAQQMRDQRVGKMNLGDILDTGLLLPFELGALKILGSHGSYAPLLLKSALAHQADVKHRFAVMSDILPKVGLLLVALLLGGLMGTAMAQLLSTVNL